MTPKTKEKALGALDGMAEIVKAEMVTRGAYVTNVKDEGRAGAVCGGRRYCAIGSLWAGYGVKPVVNHWGHASLLGVRDEDRRWFLRSRPALRLAYDSLNAAADDFVKRHELKVRPRPDATLFTSSMERLFEWGPRKRVGRSELLAIIRSAKRKVRAA